MRGTIVQKNNNYGYIRSFDSKQNLYFNSNCLLNIEWEELFVGMIVDFTVISGDVSKIATYIRKSPLVWLNGHIESISITPWGEKQFNIVTNLGSRTFWFLDGNTQIERDTTNFCVGDNVSFQCEGYKESRNQVYNITRQKLGYITNYDIKKETGLIDYTLHFARDKIINFDKFHIDLTKFFYLITYELVNDSVKSITIINQVKEIIFDNECHWIDGSIDRISTSNVGNEYMIISPCNGAACKIKSSFDDLNKYCDTKWLLPEHHVSYYIDDEQNAKEIMWTGYITRFPSNPTTKDLSARINSRIWTNEYEENNANLIYFRKNKIINHKSDEQQKNFWIDARIFNNIRRIPINTYDQRFKVRYALAEDKDYGIKAIKIKVIGVAKAPKPASKENDISILPEQNVVINNYYAPVYQQFNFIQNILQIDNEKFAEYLKNYFLERTRNLYSSKETIELLSDAIDSDLLSPISKEAALFEEQYNQALEVMSKKYNLQISELSIEWLSTKCELYLKTAIIVDFKLMGEVCLFSDLSAQSVFYGKFLEQLLKDVMYPLFKNNVDLSDMLTRLSHEGIKIVTSSKQTTIGTYCNAINRNIESISQVCSNCFPMKTIEEWETYWDTLNALLNEAKKIRNKTDHADYPICVEDINRMRSIIVDSDGIIAIMKTLYNCVNKSINSEIVHQSENDYDYLSFNYDKPFYGKNKKIQGLSGKVQNKPALLHISQLRCGYVKQCEIENFIEKVKNQPLWVKVFKESDKCVEVTLLGVTPDFDTLLG